MLKLLRILDKAIGYAYIPPKSRLSDDEDDEDGEIEPSGAGGISELAMALQGMTGIQDVHDVQERWIDNKEVWDEWEAKEKEALEREQRSPA